MYGSLVVPTGTWYHLAMVYNGTVGTLFMNGTVSGTVDFFPDSSTINVTRIYNYFGYSPFWGFGDVQLDEKVVHQGAHSGPDSA
jgi:hypothetical protein